MKKVTLLAACILVIAFISVLNSNTLAVLLTPMNPQMQKNLENMSKLMASISNQLSTGNMPQEAQKAAAQVTQQVSQILQELTDSGTSKHDVHRAGIEKVTATWEPFAAESLSND